MPPELQFDVFLCHNSKDKPFVKALAARLKDEGISYWLDQDQLMAGDLIQMKIEQALPACRCILVFFGATGQGPWQEEEIYASVNTFIQQKRKGGDYRVIPIIAEGGTEEHIPLFLQSRLWIDFRKGIEENGFRKLILSIAKREPKTQVVPQINTSQFLHLKVDRIPQARKLSRFIDKHPVSTVKGNGPYFFFVMGNREERHDLVFERFQIFKARLRQYLVKSINSTVPWPRQGDQTARQQDLIRSFEQKLELAGKVKEGDDLLRWEQAEGFQLVMMQHDIRTRSWDKDTLSTLKWYMNDFWSEVQDPDLPTWLLFINIRFTGRETPKLQAEIIQQVEQLKESYGDCARILDLLEPVSIEDVEDWVAENSLYDYESEILDSIFPNEEESQPMDKVHRELEDIMDELQSALMKKELFG